MNEFYCVVTFEITHHALQFEKSLKNAGLSVKLMPVPRRLSSSCGTAALVICEEKEKILELCNNNHIPIDGFHKMEVGKSSSWFLKHFGEK